jgi:hypothetical protein
VDVEFDEQVVTVPVELVDVVEVEGVQRRQRDGRVPVLWVADGPIAARDLGEPGEEVVAEESERRHPLARLRVEQSVALRVLGPSLDDGVQEAREVAGSHLAVAAHHRRDGDAVLTGPSVPRGDGRTHAAVLLVADGDDAPFEVGSLDGSVLAVFDALRGRPDDGPGVVGRPVVDDVDPVDVRGDRLDDGTYELRLVVGRYDDADCVVAVHPQRRSCRRSRPTWWVFDCVPGIQPPPTDRPIVNQHL